VSVRNNNVEAEATRFLGMHGYNCTKLQRARNSVQVTGGEEIVERPEADVDGFLRHQRRVILLTAIEESKAGTLDTARNSAARAMEADWQVRGQKGGEKTFCFKRTYQRQRASSS
jgi:hypothetical protein